MQCPLLSLKPSQSLTLSLSLSSNEFERHAYLLKHQIVRNDKCLKQSNWLFRMKSLIFER